MVSPRRLRPCCIPVPSNLTARHWTSGRSQRECPVDVWIVVGEDEGGGHHTTMARPSCRTSRTRPVSRRSASKHREEEPDATIYISLQTGHCYYDTVVDKECCVWSRAPWTIVFVSRRFPCLVRFCHVSGGKTGGAASHRASHREGPVCRAADRARARGNPAGPCDVLLAAKIETKGARCSYHSSVDSPQLCCHHIQQSPIQCDAIQISCIPRHLASHFCGESRLLSHISHLDRVASIGHRNTCSPTNHSTPRWRERRSHVKTHVHALYPSYWPPLQRQSHPQQHRLSVLECCVHPDAQGRSHCILVVS